MYLYESVILYSVLEEVTIEEPNFEKGKKATKHFTYNNKI